MTCKQQYHTSTHSFVVSKVVLCGVLVRSIAAMIRQHLPLDCKGALSIRLLIVAISFTPH